MIKEKTKEHGLEYVILNDNESELWEIDYDTGHAVNVSDYMKIDSLKQGSIIKYSGTIEDFLSLLSFFTYLYKENLLCSNYTLPHHTDSYYLYR
jgi:hypothetical protein